MNPRTYLDRIRALFELGRRAYGGYKSQILILTVFGFIGGILEGIGINAVIPLITFLLETPTEATDAISNITRSVFHALNIDFAPKFLLIFIVLLFLGRSLVLLVLYYTQIKITTDYEASTRARLLSATFRTSWLHLLKHKMGHLETWILIDVPASVNLLRNISMIIMLSTSLIIYLVVAFNISPSIMGTTLILGILIFIFFQPLITHTRSLSASRAQSYTSMSHWVSQSVLGVKALKASGVETRALENGRSLFTNLRDLNRRVMMLSYVTSLSVPPIGILYIAGIFALSFRYEFISLAALPAIVYLIYRITVYMQQIQTAFQHMNEQVPHLQRILDVIEGAEEESEVRTGTESFQYEKELAFENVSFSYGTKSVLENVSFSVSRGSFTGLIGPSGAGKTTCVDMFLRLLTPTSGTIRLDGTPIGEISLDEWRHRVSYVSQDLFLMNDTVRNNISFYDSSLKDDDIWKAIEQAHIADVIRKSSQGLDTMVGDRGLTLSAGQRQRIAIARALARKPAILILDEATSALDAESEQHIKSIIQELKGSITIFTVAHRLSTIMDADTLIALEDGRVVEKGAPQELLKKADSYFSRVNAI
jgi:ATP-binding cassette subfamily C protein